MTETINVTEAFPGDISVTAVLQKVGQGKEPDYRFIKKHRVARVSKLVTTNAISSRTGTVLLYAAQLSEANPSLMTVDFPVNIGEREFKKLTALFEDKSPQAIEKIVKLYTPKEGDGWVKRNVVIRPKVYVLGRVKNAQLKHQHIVALGSDELERRQLAKENVES